MTWVEDEQCSSVSGRPAWAGRPDDPGRPLARGGPNRRHFVYRAEADGTGVTLCGLTVPRPWRGVENPNPKCAICAHEDEA